MQILCLGDLWLLMLYRVMNLVIIRCRWLSHQERLAANTCIVECTADIHRWMPLNGLNLIYSNDQMCDNCVMPFLNILSRGFFCSKHCTITFTINIEKSSLKVGLRNNLHLEVCNHISCMYWNTWDRQTDRLTEWHVLEYINSYERRGQANS